MFYFQGKRKSDLKPNLYSLSVNYKVHLYSCTEICWRFYFTGCIEIVHIVALNFGRVCVFNDAFSSCALHSN